jgi:hypothetical protein
MSIETLQATSQSRSYNVLQKSCEWSDALEGNGSSGSCPSAFGITVTFIYKVAILLVWVADIALSSETDVSRYKTTNKFHSMFQNILTFR